MSWLRTNFLRYSPEEKSVIRILINENQFCPRNFFEKLHRCSGTFFKKLKNTSFISIRSNIDHPVCIIIWLSFRKISRSIVELNATRCEERDNSGKLWFIGSRLIVIRWLGLRLIANNAFQSVVELARTRSVSGISAGVSAAEFRSYWNFSSRNRFPSALRSRHRWKKGWGRGEGETGWEEDRRDEKKKRKKNRHQWFSSLLCRGARLKACQEPPPPSITDVGSGQRGNGNVTPAAVVHGRKRSFEIGKFYHFCREMFK